MALSVTDIMNGESPSSNILPATRGESANIDGLKCNSDFLRMKKAATHTADTPCEMTVASAAPLTPMLNVKMKRGSSAMFKTAPMATVAIDVKL